MLIYTPTFTEIDPEKDFEESFKKKKIRVY